MMSLQDGAYLWSILKNSSIDTPVVISGPKVHNLCRSLGPEESLVRMLFELAYKEMEIGGFAVLSAVRISHRHLRIEPHKVMFRSMICKIPM